MVFITISFSGSDYRCTIGGNASGVPAGIRERTREFGPSAVAAAKSRGEISWGSL
jgi:hypothetical protein